jgi:hypothetical protein
VDNLGPGDDVTPLLRSSPTFDDGERPRPGNRSTLR